MAFSRREFLQLAGGTAAVTLASCSPAEKPPRRARGESIAGPAPASDQASSARLRALREAVRKSGDHLSARSDAVIASRDPLAAVRFVRTELAVVPSEQPTIAGNWGARAALRAGAGTMRERAEVLAGMLGAMGLTARVREMDRPSGLTAAALWRAGSRGFTPDAAALDPLLSQAGLGRLPPVAAEADEDRRAIEGIADTLLARMPAAARHATRAASRDLPARIPVVEYTAGGKRQVAVAAGELDVLGTDAAETRDPGAMQLPTVTVAVSVALNPPIGSSLDPLQTQEVLRASWPADQLAGRRLTLTFPVPGQTVHSPRGTTPGPTRMPLLRLSDVTPTSDVAPMFVAGTLLSLSGGVFRADPDKPRQIIGPFGPLSLPPSREARTRDVATLKAAVSATTFPDVDLRVSAVDSAGRPVDGLAAADFFVTEDGRPQGAHLLADTAPSLPRVLIVYDGSMSASATFHTPQAKQAFDRRLASALVDAAARVPFATQLIAVGGTAVESGWGPPDVDHLVAAIPPSTTSDLWQSLGEAVPASGASLAILVSDNSASDDAHAIPALRARLAASGIPVISVPVGTPRREDTAAIVTASGGETVDPADPGLTRVLADLVRRRVADTPRFPYRMRYRTDRPAPGGAPRKVVVALASRRSVTATASYTVPANEERLPPPGIAGVYVAITVNGVTDIRRLGGVEVSYRGTPDRGQVNARTIEEATAAILGITTIAFEPPNPSTAELLDDCISALIALDPILAAEPQGDAAMEAQLKHLQRIPVLFTPLFEPVGAGHTDATATSLRTAILLETRTPSDAAGTPGVVDTIDVVPAHSRMLGFGDPTAAFRAAMVASLTPSYREMFLSPASAAAQLAGRPLTYLAPNAAYEAPPAAAPAVRTRQRILLDRYADMHRFVVTDGSLDAIWIADPATGSAIAIDGAGRGGATRQAGTGLACDSGNLADLLDFAALLISTYCTFADIAKGTNAWIGCVGANVEGVGTLAVGSWTDPVTIGGLSWWAGLAAAAMGAKAAMEMVEGAPPTSLARRAVETVIALMLYALGSNKHCGPLPQGAGPDGPALPPRTTSPSP